MCGNSLGLNMGVDLGPEDVVNILNKGFHSVVGNLGLGHLNTPTAFINIWYPF